ncbi:PadR family transcriptional regulator [Microbacterium sp. P01]|uniref:PadR family transcriptional regulator n=1 Tax=Microbacterium sp. P01 TaxID=3366261 RepID=UPI00366FE975
MSVRQSLLAILEQGPCYGYQLRAEFDRRTGSTWPLNVGQIYNTLDRLERDELVVKAGADEHGHVYYEITASGRATVQSWFGGPVPQPDGTRKELPIKLAIAATLPGVDARSIIRTQRSASTARRDALILAGARDERESDDSEALARALVRDAMICDVEADLRWLDRAEQRLDGQPRHALALGLAADRPKRGRPLKTATA